MSGEEPRAILIVRRRDVVCRCAVAVRWWKPTAQVEHLLPFCPIARAEWRALQARLKAERDKPRTLYDDGLRYRGWRGMGGVEFVPMPAGWGLPD